ncbi:MAG: histidine phosphatase family protein [bacterium]
MTRIFLLRHAQTADVSRFHGSESDIGLSEWGHEQSRRLADSFADLQVDAIYSSAMRRAIDTARPIAQRINCKLNQIKDLHERSMGDLAGACREKFRHVYTSAMDEWSGGNLDYTHPSGESFSQMQARGVPALKRIAESHLGKNVIVVSHGMLIRVLLASLVKGMSVADLHSIKIDNVAVNELVWDGERFNAIKLYQLPDELRNPPDDKPFW